MSRPISLAIDDKLMLTSTWTDNIFDALLTKKGEI